MKGAPRASSNSTRSLSSTAFTRATRSGDDLVVAVFVHGHPQACGQVCPVDQSECAETGVVIGEAETGTDAAAPERTLVR